MNSAQGSSKGTAIVTGASSGIGAVYADRLAARGYDLVLVARRYDRLEALAKRVSSDHGRMTKVIVADLACEEGVCKVENEVRDTPNLSVFANIAGSGALGPAAVVDPLAVEAMLKVNVLALTRLSLAAARRLTAAKQGTIINIGSIVASMPVPGAGAYGGSKAYVLNFSRSLQSELEGSGVKVQVVMPGPVHSEFFGDVPPPFPAELFMSAEVLVDTSLSALDRGETVTFPNLQDETAWVHFESARSDLAAELLRTGQRALRYAS